MSPINPISPIKPVAIPDLSQVSGAGAPPGGFQSMLESIVGGVEQSQNQAQQAVNSFLNGGNEELHSVALASQRASTVFTSGGDRPGSTSLIFSTIGSGQRRSV